MKRRRRRRSRTREQKRQRIEGGRQRQSLIFKNPNKESVTSFARTNSFFLLCGSLSSPLLCSLFSFILKDRKKRTDV